MKPGRLLLLVLLIFLVLGGAAYSVRARKGTSRAIAAISGETVTRAPSGVRIRVQVMNTTRIRGMGRRAARVLRDRGFDVVEIGTSSPPRDSTLVLDRSSHPVWAATVAKILGPAARAEARADSSRYLDVTVLLGRSWRAPTEPLDP
jgi:hypothetical protein